MGELISSEAVSPAGQPDPPTVDSQGRRLSTGIDGVELERLVVHDDHRGSLVEVMNFERPFWREPVIYAYSVTIRPRRIKGWGMHKLQTDRYYVASGNIRVVLLDGRLESPSHGALSEFHFTDRTPGLLAIPPGVWHADQNWGDSDAMIINFPTRPYDHVNPDKNRVDPHSGEIPFDWALRDG
ncbi:MAG TPA: hypothetical protein VF752_15330 [Thermoleophilaceae bacterium]